MRDVMGEKAQLHSYRIVRSDRSYLVLAATVVRPRLRVVIKLAGPDAILPCPFERTASIHRLMQTHTDVPVANILASDVSYGRWPWRYVVQTQLPGIEWASVYPQLSGQELRQAYSQIGHAVGEIHLLEFLGFGELSAAGEAAGGASYVQELEARARTRIGNHRHADLFIEALMARAPLFSGINQACLSHEDLHKHNILFQSIEGRWRLSGVLDFDSAWAGFHEADLGRMEFWDGMTGDGFWEAYLDMHPLTEEYERRKAIYQLLWCLEYASSTERHLSDTRALCLRLGLDPVLRFD